MLNKGMIKLVDLAAELDHAVMDTVDFMFSDCEEIGSSDMYACYCGVLRQLDISPSELGRNCTDIIYNKMREAIHLLERGRLWDNERLERCK